METDSKKKLLPDIGDPTDLRRLPREDLAQLCEELRKDLISTISETGGHFASSLGVVELTVALHYVFKTPDDRIVWDVGHQAYIHKMLTQRRNLMSKVRQKGGISGFPRKTESIYDSFGVGHAGTSVSAAIGMLEACFHEHPLKKERNVVAVIGDGAMTSGMVFEALNHAGQLHRNLIVVLNDNGMSIAPNVGALSWAFSRTITGRYSTSARKHFKTLVERGLIPKSFYKVLDRIEETTQGFLSAPAMLYSSFGFRYMGPIDGHDVIQLVDALDRAKAQNAPVIIHAITTKGKGYKPAENDPVRFHGVVPFQVESGRFCKPSSSLAPSYTEVFGKTLVDLCQADSRIVGITAAMPDGTGLEQLRQRLPDRFFDVGICEEHAVTFAAGLACEGMRPVVAIYSSFLQRAYDQILHDLCIQKLPVVLAIDRGGLVGQDGATHHGVFDISYLRHLPNLTLMAPKDESELRDMLATAIYHDCGPIALRFPRANGLGVEIMAKPKLLPIGKGEIVSQAENVRPEVLLIGIGATVAIASAAAEQLRKAGIAATVFNARFIKPLDKKALFALIATHPLAVTIEDNVLQGGFGSSVLEFMSEENLTMNTRLIRIGVPDEFVEHGTIAELYEECGLDANSVVNRVRLELQDVRRPTRIAASMAR